ncbi:MAG TPA: pitrilysin family protein, partial [Bacteroidota bacterium]
MHTFTTWIMAALGGAVLATGPARGQSAADIPLRSLLPLDSSITAGRLANGLSYFIRVNHKPEKRAELRLVVNAGSVLEDDDQQGLAHLVEHMAFDGTRHFAKQELVNYLESVGVRFGPDLNAYTGFDETVYILQVPTDTPSIVNKGFDILEDWAHLITFDDGQIDREKNVVIEEWRLRRGADARIRDKQFPVIFRGSRYADRLPIGKVEVLRSFKHDALKRFYRDWYRPDLMAVVAVGDFDRNEIEGLIRKHFSGIPARGQERPRTLAPVPGNDSTLFTIATDPEETRTTVSVHYKMPVEPDSLAGDYRREVVEGLFSDMLNDRLSELARKPDPPFLYAYGSHGRFVRTKDVFTLSASVKDGGVQRGLETVVTEAARVRKFGFTATELERAKKDALRGMEEAYLERQKTESAGLTDELVRHFLEGEPAPGIAFEYGLYQRFLPGITLEEVNRIASGWITRDNRVVAVSGPQASARSLPGEAELAHIIDGVDRS